ncbi:MAG: hypothetical protein E6X49_02985 [Leclercia adecarboxylata]|nr:hypothetical protein [uncultured Leclercia sp.]MDU4840097.1 hypothetical protein [Leclercia adecarboxylata]
MSSMAATVKSTNAVLYSASIGTPWARGGNLGDLLSVTLKWGMGGELGLAGAIYCLKTTDVFWGYIEAHWREKVYEMTSGMVMRGARMNKKDESRDSRRKDEIPNAAHAQSIISYNL